MHIVENMMEKQTNGREELSRLRMAWHLKAMEGKPVKERWETFKEKLKKVRLWVGNGSVQGQAYVKLQVCTLVWKQTKRNVECYLSKNTFSSVQRAGALKP